MNYRKLECEEKAGATRCCYPAGGKDLLPYAKRIEGFNFIKNKTKKVEIRQGMSISTDDEDLCNE